MTQINHTLRSIIYAATQPARTNYYQQHPEESNGNSTINATEVLNFTRDFFRARNTSIYSTYSKNPITKEKQWGYIPNQGSLEDSLFNIFQSALFVDYGGGLGNKIMEATELFADCIGIENNKEFVDKGNEIIKHLSTLQTFKYNSRLKLLHKDIFAITKTWYSANIRKDKSQYIVHYYYRPMQSTESMQKFNQAVYKCMAKGEMLIAYYTSQEDFKDLLKTNKMVYIGREKLIKLK